MKKVLIINPFYLPGYRSGGPQRTIENICETFKNQCDLYILTQNYDLGRPEEPYRDIETNTWLNLNGIQIKYIERKKYNWKTIAEGYKNFNCIYTCGLFEKNTYLLLLIHRFFRLPGKTIYVAPMGVFSKGAISLKPVRKKIFLSVLKILHAFNNITWSFSSKLEYNDALDAIGNVSIDEKYIIAEDLPQKYVDFSNKKTVNLEAPLKVIFLSRISEKKNLIQAIEILTTQTDKIVFDIYGPKENEKYWKLCLKQLNSLPHNVEWKYCGSINPAEVCDEFLKHDIFLFPTYGENFGHVIYEALMTGCIPIISDQTPWNDIESKKSGVVFSLNSQEKAVKMIKNYATDRDLLCQTSQNAMQYAKKRYNDSIDSSGYKHILLVNN